MSIIEIELLEVNYGDYLLWMGADFAKNLYITYPAIENLFNYRRDSFREKIESKALKSLLSEGLNTGKKKAVITNKHGFGTSKVNVITFELFLTLAAWEAFANQNQSVQKLVISGFGDSLRSLALAQFGTAVDEENRQEWLKFRQRSVDAFWELGNAIKHYLVSHGAELTPNYQRGVYPNCQDKINRGLFGKCAKTIRQELKVGNDALLRDHYNEIALSRLDRVQALSASFIIHKDTEPLQVVTLALGDFGYNQIDYSTGAT